MDNNNQIVLKNFKNSFLFLFLNYMTKHTLNFEILESMSKQWLNNFFLMACPLAFVMKKKNSFYKHKNPNQNGIKYEV